MSLLTVVQHVCRRTNLPVPQTVMGNSDPQILQLLGLLEEEGNDLANRGPWEGLTHEASITTTATEDQGALTTLAPTGYRYIKQETLWDRSTRLPVAGPLAPAQWQALKAMFVNGPRYRFRIRGGHLLVNPTPPAGSSWYFEYASKHWILGVDGTTYKQYFTLDADTILLPEELVLMGLRWRWKKEKGFDYAEDFRTYETQVKDTLSRDGGKPTLQQDTQPFRGPVPGVFVSPGTWLQ